jgi:hypothetical protein
MYVREQVEEQLRRRILARVPLSQNVAWLRSTGASVADAIELLEGIGLHRVEARFLLRADPGWRALIDDNTH